MSRFRFMMVGDTLSFTRDKDKDPFQFVSALRSQCAGAFCNLEAPLAEAAQPAPQRQSGARRAAWRMGLMRRTARSERWRVRLKCLADLLHPLRLAWGISSLGFSLLSPEASFHLPDDI